MSSCVTRRPARLLVPEIDELIPEGRWGRRMLTQLRPDLFGLIYFKHHLELDGHVTFSRFHQDLCSHALAWSRTDLKPAEVREAWVAPRGSGKSTWVFLILACWALAHGHRKYIAAYADTATQAQQHLTSLKREFDQNELLRYDFPELCNPARRPSGGAVSDNRGMYIAQSSAVFMARGIDSSTLGAKVGAQRPDCIILDDIEPEESNYSDDQKEKRQATILNALFPMNLNAVVLFVGTTTMPGSIIHDLVRQETEKDEAEKPEWPRDEHITINYYPALTYGPFAEPISLWPERWSAEYLESISHTRSFALNYMNDPMARDGEYWHKEDFRYGEEGPGSPIPALTHQILSIDPAVTDRTKSDFTALVVVGYSAPVKRCLISYAKAVKVAPGEQLRKLVLDILTAHPRITGVVVEVNQGGMAWRSILHDLPVPIREVHQKAAKEARAADLLTHYQLNRVVHAQRFPSMEGQMVGFPKAAHDDLVDACGTGVAVFLDKLLRARPQAGAAKSNYV
jgi:predicted phage terminase large subunit-like protein